MSQKMFLSFHTLPFRSAKVGTITHETGVQCYRTTFHTVWIPFLLILFVRCTLGSIYTLSGTATFLVEGNGTERYMGRNRTLTAVETSKRNDRKIPFLEQNCTIFWLILYLYVHGNLDLPSRLSFFSSIFLSSSFPPSVSLLIFCYLSLFFSDISPIFLSFSFSLSVSLLLFL